MADRYTHIGSNEACIPALMFSLLLAAGEGLDEIIMEALGMNGPESDEGGGPGLLTQLSRTMGSMQRFMRSLSN